MQWLRGMSISAFLLWLEYISFDIEIAKTTTISVQEHENHWDLTLLIIYEIMIHLYKNEFDESCAWELWEWFARE